MIKDYWQGFIQLFYPRVCAACSRSLVQGEQWVCLHCQNELHCTDYDSFEENPIADIFIGRIALRYGFAGYLYHKEGLLQQMIFKLKYHQAKELGQFLGEEIGRRLQQTPLQEADYIVPVPLHPRKQRKRGYNQAEWIAKGLSKTMNVPLNTTTLFRKKNTASQTKKSRIQRWENVNEVFGLKDLQTFEHQHIILVDDVVTTGSTLEACMLSLQKIENITLSVVCLAKAS